MFVAKFLFVVAAIVVIVLTMGSSAVKFPIMLCGGINTFTTAGDDNPTGKTISGTIDVICQSEGSPVSFGKQSSNTYNIWNQLSDGTFVSDAFVDTNACGFSSQVPLCQ